MPIRNPAELPGILRPGQRLLGLDVGTKTIGVALSDVSRTIASPLEVLRRGRLADDAESIRRGCGWACRVITGVSLLGPDLESRRNPKRLRCSPLGDT